MPVRAFIDAAYGVHTSSGKSHTGCAIVLSNAGALFCKSIKQKIATKSIKHRSRVGGSLGHCHPGNSYEELRASTGV